MHYHYRFTYFALIGRLIFNYAVLKCSHATDRVNTGTRESREIEKLLFSTGLSLKIGGIRYRDTENLSRRTQTTRPRYDTSSRGTRANLRRIENHAHALAGVISRKRKSNSRHVFPPTVYQSRPSFAILPVTSGRRQGAKEEDGSSFSSSRIDPHGSTFLLLPLSLSLFLIGALFTIFQNAGSS